MQKLAKENGIPANLKRDVLLKKLSTIANSETSDDAILCDQSLISEDVGVTSEDVITGECVDNETRTESDTAIVVESSAAVIEIAENVSVTSEDVMAGEGADNETPIKSDTANVASSEAITEDCALEDGNIAEIEEDDVSPVDDNEAEEEEESPEERIGCKLLGIATPVGKKQVFESPHVSKSGTKPYEKYNVHWRYEEYENGAGNSGLDAATSQSLEDCVDKEEGCDEDCQDSPLREGSKLRGVATPVGKSIYFVTPNKTAEKDYLKYNVHWT